MLLILISLLVIFIILKCIESKICTTNKCTLYIGLPGKGKSTIASYIAQKDLKDKKKKHVLSNFFIKGTEQLNEEELGKVNIEDSTVIIDEAGMSYDNRQWKTNLDTNNIYFFKHHRHYNVDIYLFSQTFDIDCKIMHLVRDIRIVNKSIIPFFIVSREIGRKLDINDKGEIVDVYYYKIGSRKYYFMPTQWKYFNSYTKVKLPEKQFICYGNENTIQANKEHEKLIRKEIKNEL